MINELQNKENKNGSEFFDSKCFARKISIRITKIVKCLMAWTTEKLYNVKRRRQRGNELKCLRRGHFVSTYVCECDKMCLRCLFLRISHREFRILFFLHLISFKWSRGNDSSFWFVYIILISTHLRNDF